MRPTRAANSLDRWRILASALIALATVIGCAQQDSGTDKIKSSVAQSLATPTSYPSDLTLEGIYQGFISESMHARSTSTRFLDEMVRAPSIHRQLVAMLTDDDPRRAKFALFGLMSCLAFDDIPQLIQCIEKHKDHREVIEQCSWTIQVRLGNGPPRDDSAEELKAWLIVHSDAWDGKNYTDYWAERLTYLLKKVSRGDTDDDLGEALSQTWFSFIESPDAKRAVPVLMDCIAKADPEDTERNFLLDLLGALQLHVGPLDVPPHREGTPARLKKSQQAALAWWEKNKGKAPVYWLFDTLATRGYAVTDPKDAESTAKALIAASRSTDPIESYTAGMVLASILPDGDSLVVERTSLLRQPDSEEPLDERSLVVRRYFTDRLLSRASHWYFFECGKYQWNSEKGKYEPSQKERWRDDAEADENAPASSSPQP